MNPPSTLHQTLLRVLPDVELGYTARSWLVPSDVDEDATVEWWAHGTLQAFPFDDDTGWVRADGVSLDEPVTDSDGAVHLTLYTGSGFTVDTSRVRNLADTLDARSADAAHFMPLVKPGSNELIDEIQDEFFAIGKDLVIVDRVRLAPAWRGAGGVGALLTATALQHLTVDAVAVAVHPFPYTLAEDPTTHPQFAESLAGVRRVWASLGFGPLEAQDEVWVMDPGWVALGNAEERLRAELLGDLQR